MEILDLAEKFETLRKTFTIITGFDGDDPTYNLLRQDIASNVNDLRRKMEKMRKIPAALKEQVEKDKITLMKVQELEKYIDHLDENLPVQCLHVKPNNNIGNVTVEEPSILKIGATKNTLQAVENYVSPCPSNWSSFLATPQVVSVNSVPVANSNNTAKINIPYLTSSELNNVPNYMRGRITLAAVNSCIDAFNTTLNKKYAIMSQKRKDLKHKDLNMYIAWKTQDDLKKDKWYCTQDDLINLAAFKMEKSAYNIITILRHLKRIQEVKIKGMKSRYIVQ